MAGGRCVTETPLGVKCREGRLSIRRSGAVQGSDPQASQYYQPTDRQFRHRPGAIARERRERHVVAPHPGAATQCGAGVDAGIERIATMAGQQRCGIDPEDPRHEQAGRSPARGTRPAAGTDEGIAASRLRPEEHMRIDQSPPEIGAAGETAAERSGQAAGPPSVAGATSRRGHGQGRACGNRCG